MEKRWEKEQEDIGSVCDSRWNRKELLTVKDARGMIQIFKMVIAKLRIRTRRIHWWDEGSNGEIKWTENEARVSETDKEKMAKSGDQHMMWMVYDTSSMRV